MRNIGKLLWLCIMLAAAAPARASGVRATARRALAGHDHDHPVCDDEYRSTVCPEACDADDAGRRGGAADPGAPGEQVAGLVEEVTLILWILPHIPWI